MFELLAFNGLPDAVAIGPVQPSFLVKDACTVHIRTFVYRAKNLWSLLIGVGTAGCEHPGDTTLHFGREGVTLPASKSKPPRPSLFIFVAFPKHAPSSIPNLES